MKINDAENSSAYIRRAAYESWPAATGPQPVAAPLVKKVKPVKAKGAGEGTEETEVEVEKDEGEATPEGNKRLLADILSVSDVVRRQRLVRRGGVSTFKRGDGCTSGGVRALGACVCVFLVLCDPRVVCSCWFRRAWRRVLLRFFSVGARR